MSRAKLAIIVFSGVSLLAGMVVVAKRRQPAPLLEPELKVEVEAKDGSVSAPGATERVELVIQFKPEDPTKGAGRVRVRQLDKQGVPGKFLYSSGPFEVFRPQGSYLELADLDKDRDQEIIVASGVAQDQGELRIFSIQGGDLAWFCRLPDRAACVFPYRFNRPEVVDLDNDGVFEVVEYGPQPLGGDRYNYDRYSVYKIYVFREGTYFGAEGAVLEGLSEAFARKSRLPLAPTKEGL